MAELMKKLGLAKTTFLIPGALGLLALVALALWLGRGSDKPLALRVPGTDQAPGSELGGKGQPRPRRQAHPIRRPAGESSRRVAAVSRAKP